MLSIDSLEIKTFKACVELVSCQKKILALMASHLNLMVNEIFFAWAFRTCNQTGKFSGDWRYFFHGLECDVKNEADGRFLRIDFGPDGRIDTFTAWGLLQFIMTSKFPWPSFSTLKQHFSENGPPYDQFSGDIDKMNQIWNFFVNHTLLEVADKELLRLKKKYTFVEKDGIAYIKFPSEISEKKQINCSVAHRMKISGYGKKLLRNL